MEDLRTWLRQPTTVAGISALSAVSMLLPDNTGAHEQAQQLASEILTKITDKKEAAK